jgi:hypothetical protein
VEVADDAVVLDRKVIAHGRPPDSTRPGRAGERDRPIARCGILKRAPGRAHTGA